MADQQGRYSDLDIVIMLVAVPVTVLIVVAVVKYIQERNEKRMRSAQRNNEEVTVNNMTSELWDMRRENPHPLTNIEVSSSTFQSRQSDHQMIFGDLSVPVEITPNFIFQRHPLPGYDSLGLNNSFS